MDDSTLAVFTRWAESLFPNLKFHDADWQTQTAIKDMMRGRGKYPIIERPSQDELWQGDIIDKVPFAWVDEDGDLVDCLMPAMVLSATCDIDNDDRVTVCACIEEDEFLESGLLSSEDLANQCTLRYFHLSGGGQRRYVADFGTMFSLSPQILSNAERMASLTRFGYYLLLTKLTVHLMRPDPVFGRTA